MDSSGAYPTTEQTLSALSVLLNGGGLGQVQDITRELNKALANGRDSEIPALLGRINDFVAQLDDQSGAIIDATQSLDDLASQIAQQRPVVDQAVRTLPSALATLRDQRAHLVDALKGIGEFSSVANDAVGASRDALVQEVKDIGPVLRSLASAGPSLTRALDLLVAFPFPKKTLDKFLRGDYANTTAIVDLTLSRIDQNMFTGTRFEGDLTRLELEWGRTIGQLPSPYSAGNPLTAPYHEWQGP